MIVFVIQKCWNCES